MAPTEARQSMTQPLTKQKENNNNKSSSRKSRNMSTIALGSLQGYTVLGGRENSGRRCVPGGRQWRARWLNRQHNVASVVSVTGSGAAVEEIRRSATVFCVRFYRSATTACYVPHNKQLNKTKQQTFYRTDNAQIRRVSQRRIQFK